MSKLRKIFALARAASRHYNQNIFIILIKLMRLKQRHGYMLHEIDLMGLLAPDPGLHKGAIGLSTRKLMNYQDKLNPVELGNLVNHKLTFHKRCREAGLRVPDLYATGRPSFEIVASLPESFLVKPEYGAGGFGVSAYTREGDIFRAWNGKEYNTEELVGLLEKTTGSRNLIFQEWVRVHPDLNCLAGMALLTIRSFTLMEGNSARMICNYLRIPTATALTDNIKVGLGGEGMLELDAETGEVGHFWCRHESGFGIIRSDRVGQRNQVPVKEVTIPYWKEARELALDLAELYPELRFLGWDIGISENGPVAIEGNTHWGYPYAPEAIKSVMAVMPEWAGRSGHSDKPV